MKQTRTFIVLAVALVTAGAAAYAVYQAIQRRPVREVEVASVQVVVATRQVPVGAQLSADDLKVVPWPARNQTPGAFQDPEPLVGRGVVATIGENEPVTTAKVAPAGAGAGLAPVIPPGMRAISVRVNEVIGVAGFVVPGTRVDVLVVSTTGDGDGGRREPIARTIVSNVQVLTAGSRNDAQTSADNNSVPATVVTLAVSPTDGERIALASTEGRISLTLRNPADLEPTQTPGVRMGGLMRGSDPAPAADPQPKRPRPAPRPVVVEAPPPPAAPPPIRTIETIRAGKLTEDEID